MVVQAMTVTEANAANEIAREVLRLAETVAIITPDLEHGVVILLINAHKRLAAGYTPESFLAALTSSTWRSLAEGGRPPDAAGKD
jgi:hypothetical protein